jgi:deoxyadenosine/deoxycytidine kinase
MTSSETPPLPTQPQRIFFVEGNIGSGKTTFLQEMVKMYPDMCQVIYEPLEEWRTVTDTNGDNILDHFYRDMPKTAYTFQSLAFLTRARSLESIDPTVPFVFVERSVFSDMEVFAKNCVDNGAMTSIEWEVYTKWFDWMVQKLPIENASHLYLRCEPDISLQRLHRRNRDEENSIADEYIHALHARHEQWLYARPDDGRTATPQLPVTVLDASIDFRGNHGNCGVQHMAARLDATFAVTHG